MSVLAPRTTSLAVTPSVSSQRDSVRLSRDCLRPKLSRQLQEPHVTLIEYKNARFLITDQPSPTNMEHFIIVSSVYTNVVSHEYIYYPVFRLFWAQNDD